MFMFSLKLELEQEVEAVQTRKPMDKEAFDGLPDKVSTGGMFSSALSGLTHNKDGIKKSYDQYVQDFVSLGGIPLSNSELEKEVRTSSIGSRQRSRRSR